MTTSSAGEAGPARPASAGTTLSVWALPGARRSAVEGVVEGWLRVRLAAPAREGAANAELVRVLAAALGVPRVAVEVVRGAGARRKAVLVRGLAPAEVLARLGVDGGGSGPG